MNLHHYTVNYYYGRGDTQLRHILEKLDFNSSEQGENGIITIEALKKTANFELAKIKAKVLYVCGIKEELKNYVRVKRETTIADNLGSILLILWGQCVTK